MFVAASATRVWGQTTELQRSGYRAAGIGLTAGQFLYANLPKLVELLVSLDISTRRQFATAAVWLRRSRPARECRDAIRDGE